MIEKETPIEEILFDVDILPKNARHLCRECGIRTAQQLATYNRFAFKIEGQRRGFHTGHTGRTIDYLEECLKRIGMSFAPEPPQAKGHWAPYRVYGAENAKEDILRAMRVIKHPEFPINIAAKAASALREKLEPYEYESAPPFFQGKKWFSAKKYADSVFETRRVSACLKELVKEGKVAQWEVTKGRSMYERRDIPTKPIIEDDAARRAYRKLFQPNRDE